ncbi:cytohesin-1 protein [Apis cerana cerana]|uniref:Cytohesin-1 protein n=1 Tax=Apis cerana cerana TaxID=94128 RepID=A0A2A3E0R2_APICC|nr:cytohesin-1 protein [Apis cerana cerana]
MWQDLDGLGGAGVNSGAHQLDQFGTTELTPEHQKILIDIRRKKTELLLEIQVSQLPISYHYFCGFVAVK